MNTQNEPAQQLANDIMTEHNPISHESFQSVLRLVSRLSTRPDIKAIDRNLLNQAYTLIKQKYREWERLQSIGMPKNYGDKR